MAIIEKVGSCRRAIIWIMAIWLAVWMMLSAASVRADTGETDDPVQLGPSINGGITFITPTTVNGVGVMDVNFHTVMYMKSATRVGEMLLWEMTYFPDKPRPWTVIYKDENMMWCASSLEVPTISLTGTADVPNIPGSVATTVPTAAPANSNTGRGDYSFWDHLGDPLAYGVHENPLAGSADAVLRESDGMRSGPSIEYSEWGTFLYYGQRVKLISYTYDGNNAPWVQVEYSYSGRTSRSYTLYMRLEGAPLLSQIPREFPLGRTVTVTRDTVPSTGPGSQYEAYRTMNLLQGRQGTAIAVEGDWIMADFPGIGDKHIFRVWVPSSAVDMQ